jgi:hypothetical protein
VSHGSKGKREQGSRALPVMPGLPILDSVSDAEIKNIGRVWQHQPSESKFEVPTRSQNKRSAGQEDRGGGKTGNGRRRRGRR